MKNGRRVLAVTAKVGLGDSRLLALLHPRGGGGSDSNEATATVASQTRGH